MVAADLPFADLVVVDHIAQRLSHMAVVHNGQSEGMKDAGCEDQDDQRDAPHKIADLLENLIDLFHLLSPFLSGKRRTPVQRPAFRASPCFSGIQKEKS